jgi:hypothetical protein
MQLGKVRIAQQLVKARGKYLTVEHVETAPDNQRRELESGGEGIRVEGSQGLRACWDKRR